MHVLSMACVLNACAEVVCVVYYGSENIDDVRMSIDYVGMDTFYVGMDTGSWILVM